ncbi:HAMP domain-containing protein [Streptomyces sp. NPDC094468]|uniref:cache domain-containing protein n=1 Tax=Streptomyces sp. NPDC094468 TaxID=3366066 RepID=UPI0038110822
MFELFYARWRSAPREEGPPARPIATRDPRRHRIRRRADMPLLGGIRPPVASLTVLMLAVAVVTVFTLNGIRTERVPQALLDGQQQIAADFALSMRTEIDAEARTVRRTADMYPATGIAPPTTALKSLHPVGKTALATVLLDPATGKLLAARGNALPLAGADLVRTTSERRAIRPRLVTSNGTRQLLYFARVTLPTQQKDANQDQNLSQSERSWLLVVAEALPDLATYGDGRTTRVIDASGRASPAADGDLSAAVIRAVREAGKDTDASGSLLGAAAGDRRTVAGWAQVASMTGPGDTDDLGLVVLTSRPVVAAAAPAAYLGSALQAAGTLAVLALLLWLTLHITLQRPLLRLYLSASRLARGVSQESPAAWEELSRRVPVHGFGELARTGRALESLRRQLLGEIGPEGFRDCPGPGYRALVLAEVFMVTCWAIPMIFMLNRADPATAVPNSVLAVQQTRTEIASNRLRQSLDQLYVDLNEAAAALPGMGRAAQTQVLRHALADHRSFDSLYLVNRSGGITLRVGGRPLRTLLHVPGKGGIIAVNSSGPIPAIAAYAKVPIGKDKGPAAGVMLFGEIDVKALNSILSRPKLGGVWVTDGDDRVLAASVGYRAFQPLPDFGLSRLVRALQGAPGTTGTAAARVLRTSSGPSLGAAAPLARSGPTALLGWHLVTAEPAAALKIPAMQAEQRTTLAGILGLSLGSACLGWLYVVVIRPLRSVAVLAERLAGGDRRTVLHPVNYDEVGSVTRSLELVRQALAQSDRAATSSQAALPSSSLRQTIPQL